MAFERVLSRLQKSILKGGDGKRLVWLNNGFIARFCTPTYPKIIFCIH